MASLVLSMQKAVRGLNASRSGPERENHMNAVRVANRRRRFRSAGFLTLQLDAAPDIRGGARLHVGVSFQRRGRL